MKRSILSLAVLAALSGFSAGPVRADAPAADQGKGQNVSTEKGKPGDASEVANLQEAAKLVAYARDNESPTVMLAAVQMIEKVPLADKDGKVGAKTSQDDPKATKPSSEAKKGDATPPTFDCEKLLAEAKSWAKDDANINALIDAEAAKVKAGQSGTLGATAGPSKHYDRVQPGQFDQYTVTFNGGEQATVGVVGDDTTDLDLYVYDENGNLIAKDDDLTDECLCEWVPQWTGNFIIRIYNRGAVYNDYVIATN